MRDMKRLALIAFALFMCMSSYAQAYDVDFSINHNKTVVTCKVKNNTKFNMLLLRGHFTDLKSYCEIYYLSENKEVSMFEIDVVPDRKRVVIKPGGTHFHQIDLKPYKKKYHITKLEGVFTLVYQKPSKELVSETIKRTIEFE